jgi:choline dehydrogenase-like flavoprotein
MEGSPSAPIDSQMLKSWFWQFARSRIDRLDLMRFGPEFMALRAPNVRVLVNATVTHIDTDESGSAFIGVEVSTIEGARARVRAKTAVLAAGAIENARLLLASRRAAPEGLGNRNGLVGRFLMDHPGARIGRFKLEDVGPINKRFGFYGVRHRGRRHMYMHGLALSEALQEREGLLHAAAYMMEERAPDDPWDALKRLLRRSSEKPAADMLAVASSPGLLAKGIGMKALESNAVPQRAKDLVVNGMIRLNPNFVAREFQSRGLPHKLTGIVIDGITEQAPDPDSRITLSDRTDALGVPLARVDWRIDERAYASLMRLGHALTAALPRAGLPAPILEDRIIRERPGDAAVIDMAHSCGTTRMSADPARGVVDANAQVHGVNGLYVAGGSVFPTSGHANPTLMIVALAIRLADRIKADFKSRARQPAAPAVHSRSAPMRKKILVTGAAGLIGRHLVPELQRAGYDVRATYRSQPGQIAGAEWRHLDLLDHSDFDAVAEGCDGVIHLAAELSDTARMHRVNVEATSALLQAAQKAGARYFGYASSIVVHGSPRRRHVDETTALLDPDGPLVKQYRAEPYTNGLRR